MKQEDGVNGDYNANAMLARIMQRMSAGVAKSDPSILEKPYNYFVNNQDFFNAYCSLYSKGKVAVDANKGTVTVNGKAFMTPVAAGDLSGAQRAYFVAGNLAAVYNAGNNTQAAYIEGGTVKIAGKAIVTPAYGDVSASELAELLNSIK